MKIENYIAQLLYRYQCVTVPGFGAFLTEIQSAQLVESAHSFFPPKKLISFNAYLKNNDGLLANHIAQTEKTSYEYAVSAIQYEVFNWKKTLQETGIFTIKNVGDFRLNADSNLIFTPSEQTNYLSSSFGLSPFVSPLVKRELFEQQLEALEETETIQLVPKHKNKYSFLKYAAIFVLGLGLTATVGYPIYQNEIETQKIIVETAVQRQVQNKIQEATFFIESPIPAVTLTVKEGKLPYHIMAGAFRDETNAQRVFENLSEKGYKAKRIERNKYGLYPVLYGSFTTYAEAEKLKNEIRAKENPQAWILIESL
ncbi:SPOR domain-containing protein [Flavobacterium sp.]|uniref:HU domain-containing protein n=1 Tax=Flavobacterium sp. TaxID=239 RepID=UPI0008AC880F|nr:SPOR domain-containing protein [Flavobacterium sp.]OGS64426.1 MAG: sporulation protein [Flavobacteria bacterium GWA2_35_26]HCF04418.1 SPOR domain-containing protein [Flavobacterium sp.]